MPPKTTLKPDRTAPLDWTDDDLPPPRLPAIARNAKPPPVEEEVQPRMKPVLMVPTSPDAVLNNLVARDIVDPAGPLEPVSATIGILTKLVSGIASDGDIAEVKDSLTRITSHQQEKSDVFQAILNQLDQERVADMVEVRAHSEKVIKRASMRGDMTTGEAIHVWRTASDVIDKCQLRQKNVKAVDTVTVVEKVDLKKQELERSVQQRWEGTTPQGREIIRKKLFALKRQMLAQDSTLEATGTLTTEVTTPS